MLHLLNLLRVERTGGETKVGQLDVASAIYKEVLRLEVTVNVAKLVKLVDTGKHLCGIEAGVFLLENAGVVQEGSEVSTRNILHGKVDVFLVLESVEETYEPRSLDGGENVSLDENMLDLVHLGKSTLAHLLESAHLIGVRLAGEIHRAVATLADLSDDAELINAELCTAFAEKYSLTSIVALKLFGVCLAGDLRVRMITNC